MIRNLKNEMHSCFAKHGLLFGRSDAAIVKRLRKLMGDERFEEFDDRW